MLSSERDMMTDNDEIVKEGYLDVKYPPGCPERKRWKVWHRRWITAKVLKKNCKEAGNIVYLQVTDNNPAQQQQLTKNSTILWKVEVDGSAKIFRSHSRSRLQKAFGIAQSLNQDHKVLVYLAGEDERQTQQWMEALRNAILPPSSLIQDEDPSKTRYSVSLIDDIGGFNQGLLGAYGYLITMPSSIGIIHPHFRHCIAEWPLSLMQEGKLIRCDRDNSASGVVAFSLKTRSKLRENQQLCFYSPEAKKITAELNEIIRSSKEVYNDLSLNSNSKNKNSLKKKSSNNEKFDAQYASVVKVESPHSDMFISSYESSNASSSTLNLKVPWEVSSNFLNCSISSSFQGKENLNSSSDESDYSPPTSPLRSDFCGDFDSAKTDKKYSTQNVQTYLNKTEQLNSEDLESENSHSPKILRSDVYNNDIRRQSTFYLDSHIYADVTISRTWRQQSIGGDTLYEELLDSPTEIEVKDDEEQYVPPLPPPRCPARRPSTLRLEQLSENVENTLLNLQKISPTQSIYERKSAVNTIWGNPLKSVKKILSKDKKAKSEQSSPIGDSPKDQQNGIKMKSKEMEDILSDIRNLPSENNACPADCKHSVTEIDLPVPFLPRNPVTPESTTTFPTGRKHSWSVDNLQLEDLKHKHSCLRHFIQHLENKSNDIDGIPCYCSCPSSNQYNTPTASPKTASTFARRQSKSLSADIEKHFRTLHLHAGKKMVKKGLFISNFTTNGINGQSQDPMDDYCPMGFAPTPEKKLLVNGKVHRLLSEDHQYEYMDMDLSKRKDN